MFDQSFSAENFRKIFDYENREGKYLEGRFFPGIEAYSRKLRTYGSGFRRLKELRRNSRVTEAQYEAAKGLLNSARNSAETQKETLLNAELEKIAATIAAPSFAFKVVPAILRGKKKGYITDRNDPATFFCMKQMQTNVRTMFKVRPGNRNAIVSHIKNLLNDRFPKCVVRTDLRDFYESVDRKDLMKSLIANTLLSQSTRRLIRKLFRDCPGKGLPRGIGISAHLAEVAARGVDRTLEDLPGLIYYGRYVDDIVLIFSNGENLSASEFLDSVRSGIESRKFALNARKTTSFHAPDCMQAVPQQFEYLGYRFSCPTAGGVEIGLSSKRVQKYRVRVGRAFAEYGKGARAGEERARKLLLHRILFLTSNTRLLNNKKNVYIGAYFSNSHLTDFTELDQLDRHLSALTMNRSRILKNKLSGLSFRAGFKERTFVTFTAQELQELAAIWKHE